MMDYQPSRHASCLEGLPTEIKQIILASISDTRSLQAAILSGPSLYWAFLGHEESIATTVLINEVGEDVLPEATIALELRKCTGTSPAFLHDFVEIFLENWRPVEPRYKLKDTIQMVTRHENVAKFTEYIMRTSKNCSGLDGFEHFSQAEIGRTQRALYRLELYYGLSGRCSTGAADREFFTDLFNSKFSLQECQQLVCIDNMLQTFFATISQLFTGPRNPWYQNAPLDYKSLREVFGVGLSRTWTARCLSSGLNGISKVLSIQDGPTRSMMLSRFQLDGTVYVRYMATPPQTPSPVSRTSFSPQTNMTHDSALAWILAQKQEDRGHEIQRLCHCGYALWDDFRFKQYTDSRYRAEDFGQLGYFQWLSS